jgi:hypothetical protein
VITAYSRRSFGSSREFSGTENIPFRGSLGWAAVAVSEARSPCDVSSFSRDQSFPGFNSYLCRCCKRTVSLLPEFASPYLRFGIVVIALFLVARLLLGLTLNAAAESAKLVAMPYQRGQFWVRRFRKQAEKVCAALAALMAPPGAPDFTSRALQMVESIGWITAHRFLFADLRVHLLGWPAFLAAEGGGINCFRRGIHSATACYITACY